ncbi:MAG: hypothetical protein AAB332_02225 [Planctomycetota bacterium]
MCINLWALPWAVVLRPFGAIVVNTVRLGLSVLSFLNLTRMGFIPRHWPTIKVGATKKPSP